MQNDLWTRWVLMITQLHDVIDVSLKEGKKDSKKFSCFHFKENLDDKNIIRGKQSPHKITIQLQVELEIALFLDQIIYCPYHCYVLCCCIMVIYISFWLVKFFQAYQLLLVIEC